MRSNFKALVESTILEHDPEEFAERFSFLKGESISPLLQFEVYGDEGEETLVEEVIYYGSGTYSREFFEYEGDKYCFHFSNSFDVEEYMREMNAESPKLREWVHKCRNQEEWLDRTEVLVNLVGDAESKSDIKLPDHDDYNVELIRDMIDDKFNS